MSNLLDLRKIDGKAELIGGTLRQLPPSGKLHARISKRILIDLDAFVQRLGVGEAFGDALGYALPAPLPNGRESFCPDVSYFAGPDVGEEARFIDGPPTFAVEVRSEHDYGPAAEREMADKRADYFQAGTLVVWDVDPQAKTVAVYCASAPDLPDLVTTGGFAHAKPALDRWQLNVAELFA